MPADRASDYRLAWTARAPGSDAEMSKAGVGVAGRWPAGKDRAMQALTPASADDLPPLGQLIVDDPFWRYQQGDSARESLDGRLRAPDRPDDHGRCGSPLTGCTA